MTTPWKHPKSGVYYFRKGVPPPMRELVGKREVKCTLGTTDLKLASKLHAVQEAKTAADWARLLDEGRKAKPDPRTQLSQQDVSALAGELYREVVDANRANPGRPSAWRDKLTAIQRALPPKDRDEAPSSIPFAQSWAGAPRQVAHLYVGDVADAFLTARKLLLTGQSQREFYFRAAGALAQAYRLLERYADGDYSPDPRAARFPEKRSALTWKALYEEYARETRPDPSSRKRAFGVLAKFFAFVGHERPADVTEEDAISWKAKRLQEVQTDTVRSADLAHPRAMFEWARVNRHLPNNPFRDVHVRKRKGKGGEGYNSGKREYTLEEARKVLRGTLQPPSRKLTAEGAAARRWVPWICAYTGARVGEIAQARAEDVYQAPSYDGSRFIWVIHITPEAGRVKTDQPREVALHAHLIEQGFLDYVASRQGKCLFYDPGRRRGGKPENPQYAKVGERLAAWIRTTVGVRDRAISPNHAWRHLFRSYLLHAKINEQVIDFIDGHAPASVGRKYGRVWPEVTLEAVSTIPAYVFDELHQVGQSGAGP